MSDQTASAEKPPAGESKKSSPEEEFKATQDTYSALKSLDDAARKRVINHVAAMFGVAEAKTLKNPGTPQATSTDESAFESFADLFNAASPETTANRALVAGYWIQVCEGATNFDGQRANTELKHLGHGVDNITQALTSLIEQKPALVMQLKKSGKSKQARKTYKVTVAGIAAVKSMLDG